MEIQLFWLIDLTVPNIPGDSCSRLCGNKYWKVISADCIQLHRIPLFFGGGNLSQSIVSTRHKVYHRATYLPKLAGWSWAWSWKNGFAFVYCWGIPVCQSVQCFIKINFIGYIWCLQHCIYVCVFKLLYYTSKQINFSVA